MNEKEKLYNVKIELKIPAKDEKEAEHIFWEYVDDMFNDIHPDIEEVED